MLAAVLLTAALHIEIDLAGTFPHIRRGKAQEVVCGIRVVGYRFTGRPGQQFRYDGETFAIPRAGFVELLSVPRLKEYSFAARKLPLHPDDGWVDGFGFRWIELPSEPSRGGNAHE